MDRNFRGIGWSLRDERHGLAVYLMLHDMT